MGNNDTPHGVFLLTSPVHGPDADGHLDVGVVQAGFPHGGSSPGEAKPASSARRASKSLG